MNKEGHMCIVCFIAHDREVLAAYVSDDVDGRHYYCEEHRNHGLNPAPIEECDLSVADEQAEAMVDRLDFGDAA